MNDRADRWGHEEPYRDANAPRLIRTPGDLLEVLGIEHEPPAVQRLRLDDYFSKPRDDVPDAVRVALKADGLLSA